MIRMFVEELAALGALGMFVAAIAAVGSAVAGV
jgi:hypothetical protein